MERAVVASEVQEILNYFGKCPMCGEPARARRITARFDDGRVASQDVGECGGWCGWKGPVRAEPMTGDAVVVARAPHRLAAEPHPGLPA